MSGNAFFSGTGVQQISPGSGNFTLTSIQPFIGVFPSAIGLWAWNGHLYAGASVLYTLGSLDYQTIAPNGDEISQNNLWGTRKFYDGFTCPSGQALFFSMDAISNCEVEVGFFIAGTDGP